MRDPAVPALAKLVTVAAAGLIISPLDLLGDIPILGQIDDVILLGFVVHLFVKFSERVLAKTTVIHNITPQPTPSDAIALR